MGQKLVLFKHVETDDIHKLGVYRRSGGYEALRKAIDSIAPSEVTAMVKDSGLRGRGGAGFPTGMKWSFLPKEYDAAYLVCNADESEPGAFKDRELMERNPHQLIEGCLLAAYAIKSQHAFIYVRGEYLYIKEILDTAIEEARGANLVGARILGGDWGCEITVYRGAGAYICGEESAMLDSLEGFRGFPRQRPPFPAVRGLYGQPTVVNNVETLANVPHIVLHGADWFKSMGTERSSGTKVCSISGPVNRPGNYELEMGTPFRELLELAGGMREGTSLKAYIPGGASAPMVPASQLDVGIDYESYSAIGSTMGSASFILFPEDTCIVFAQLRLSEFFAHESCGKCTPCREGTQWLRQMVQRIEAGDGREEDIPILQDVADNMLGKCFCALGDFATSNIMASIKHFRAEYEEHIHARGCPYKGAIQAREESPLLASATV
jgi:NADH-quinone oxidoreductase subunit F